MMILKNLIYILQSEGYYPGRFLKFAYTHPKWWGLEKRQKIVWTLKARLIWIESAMLFWITAGLLFLFFRTGGLLLIVFLLLALPFLVAISSMLLLPVDAIIKQERVNAAKKIISESRVCVIGIAGSYGKTSAKEILAAIIKQQPAVIKTPENINTLIGIADFIIKNKEKFKKNTVFIVEMGAYKIGEIARICKMVHPTYSILTGINESHLERFGSLKNIIQGKFELPQNTAKLAMLNFDDENIKNNYAKFSIKKIVGISKSEARNIVAMKNFKGLKFEWQGMAFETSLLAKHNVTLILLCAALARQLSVSLEKICAGVKNVKPIVHRLQPIYNASTDIMIIDDSYNGNYNGVTSGIKLLDQASGRKVVLTPGLVELGPSMKDTHRRIGELYAKNVGLVLLIKSRMTGYIIEGLKKNNFTNYKVYGTTQEAHNDLKKVLMRGDTIIFQNDLTDNYF